MSANNGFYLIGKVVQQPELKVSGQGKNWTKLMLEVDDFKFDGTPMGTSLHTMTAFGKTAESVASFQPGDILAVAGDVGSRKWEKDGKSSYFVDLNVREVVLITPSDYDDPTEPETVDPPPF